jgi:hypothetical protein
MKRNIHYRNKELRTELIYLTFLLLRLLVQHVVLLLLLILLLRRTYCQAHIVIYVRFVALTSECRTVYMFVVAVVQIQTVAL